MKRHAFALALSALLVAAQENPAASEPMRVLQTLRGGIDGIEGLDGPRSVAVSPDGRHVYVASRDGTIAIFERNAESGRLRQLGVARNGEAGIAGLDDPSNVIVSGDGANVYATSETPPAVVAFARDAETGTLTFLEAVTEDFTCPLFAKPKRCPLFARLSHDDSRLLVLDGGQFEREPGTGALGARLPFPVTSNLEFAQTPDGRHYYGWINVAPDGDIASVFTPPDGTGDWTWTSLLGSWSFARVSPDGSRLYGFNRADGTNRVCWASIDAESGEVGAQACRPEQILTGPLAAEIAPDGTYYLAAFTTLYRYAWDPNAGGLAEPEAIAVGNLSEGIAPSPDSRFVYSVFPQNDRLTVVPEAGGLGSGAAALLALTGAARRARHDERRRRSREGAMARPRPSLDGRGLVRLQ